VETDLLGAPYERQTIDLGADDEGPVVATLVRRRAETPTRRAVLYVHGFVDYFFQTHLADFYVERGWDFYAVDLRKYGRSLLQHQTPNFCRDLTDYYRELDEVVRLIRRDDEHDTLLVNGHSTGGLLISLWAHDRRDAGLVDALFLNSPFFDLNAPWLLRRPGAAAIGGGLGRARPYRVIPFALTQTYGESLHSDRHGEWSYDLAWKPLAGFPVRAGWLHAIRSAQRRLQAGLDIAVPVLVARSGASYRGRWSAAAMGADAVLDVAHMSRWAPGLGRHVTLVRIDGGLHDLTLSPEPARKRLFSELDRWLAAYVA
jgi:alpha-beta hydrolase superfamily lysophospholipase